MRVGASRREVVQALVERRTDDEHEEQERVDDGDGLSRRNHERHERADADRETTAAVRTIIGTLFVGAYEIGMVARHGQTVALARSTIRMWVAHPARPGARPPSPWRPDPHQDDRERQTSTDSRT